MLVSSVCEKKSVKVEMTDNKSQITCSCTGDPPVMSSKGSHKVFSAKASKQLQTVMQQNRQRYDTRCYFK